MHQYPLEVRQQLVTFHSHIAIGEITLSLILPASALELEANHDISYGCLFIGCVLFIGSIHSLCYALYYSLLRDSKKTE